MNDLGASSQRVSRARKKGSPKQQVSVRLSEATLEAWPQDELGLGPWIDELARKRGHRPATSHSELRRHALRMAVWAAASLDRIAARCTMELTASGLLPAPEREVCREITAGVLVELAAIRARIETLLP